MLDNYQQEVSTVYLVRSLLKIFLSYSGFTVLNHGQNWK